MTKTTSFLNRYHSLELLAYRQDTKSRDGNTSTDRYTIPSEGVS